MKEIRVCVFPAHGESGVEINNALSQCEGIFVYGIAVIPGHSAYNFINYTPNFLDIDEEGFDDKFESFILENQIDVVFPTSDATLLYFSENQSKFSAKFVNCDAYSANICNDKRKTYELFKEYSFCPKLYKKPEKFPCFIKPFDGEGARGAMLLNNAEEVPIGYDWSQYVCSEYLPGTEMTVDCITDYNGELKAVLPRIRKKTFAGMCVMGETVEVTAEIAEIAETINSHLKFRGLWFFQVKQDDNGVYKLLEISMRCAGTMCMTRARGYNLPLLSVYTTMGKPIQCIENNLDVTISRTLFARYKTSCNFSTVYVDYDGTIVIKNKVSLSIIRFLYQCKNENKKIVMITRHNEDHNNTIYEDLDDYGISKKLFDEIICLRFDEKKSSVIKDEDAIFIDNSFFERKEVSEAKNIPVFAVEGIDLLQDWRL